MKTMTCRDLGGPCELAHTGNDADEVIKAQDQHLKDAVASGDTTHEDALRDMKRRWRRPRRSMQWYKSVKAEFAARPEDQ